MKQLKTGTMTEKTSRPDDKSNSLEIQRQRTELVKLTKLLIQAENESEKLRNEATVLRNEVNSLRIELNCARRLIALIDRSFVENFRMPFLDKLFKPARKRWLERSGIFDREWYLSTNPDIAESNIDPLQHFLEHGAKEGRAPANFKRQLDDFETNIKRN